MLVKESLKKLNELGEANVKPYDFYLEDSEMGFDSWVEYKFKTEDKDKYIVNFIKTETKNEPFRPKNYWVVQFSLTGKKSLHHEQVVNKGRNFRVMATVVAIIKTFVEWKHPDKMFMSAAKSKEDDKRRLNMYMRYLEKQITGEYTFKSENVKGEDVIVVEKL